MSETFTAFRGPLGSLGSYLVCFPHHIPKLSLCVCLLQNPVIGIVDLQ